MKILNLRHDEALFLHIPDEIIRRQTLHGNFLALKVLRFALFKKNVGKIEDDVFKTYLMLGSIFIIVSVILEPVSQSEVVDLRLLLFA